MRSSILIGGVVVAAGLLLARSVRAGADDAVLRNASGRVWAMTEWHHEFTVRRLARGITPEKERTLAEATAGKFAAQRNKLAAVRPKLSPGTRFTTDVAHFVQMWPTRDVFLQDLLDPAHGEQAGLAITSLAMQVTHPRRRSRTLFPFFRP